jgi:ATP-binding cassette subfamily B protein
LTTVRNADEILVVTDSGIAERGDHDSLLQQDGIYAGLWRGVQR